SVLILGGGDGLVAKEVQKYPALESTTLVEEDSEYIELSKNNPTLQTLNHNSLIQSNTHIINQDPFAWVKTSSQKFSVVFLDFPPEANLAQAKTLTYQFIRQLRKLCTPTTILAFKLDFYDNPFFWTAVRTIR